MSESLKNLAIRQSNKNNIPKAIELTQLSLEIARQINDPTLLSNTLNLLGRCYETVGLFDKAVSSYLESLTYSIKNKDDKQLCFTYRNLGKIFESIGNSQKSREYYDKGTEVAKRSNHHMIQYIPDLDLGNYYKRNRQYEKALTHLDKSYKLCSNNYAKAAVLLEISRIYEEQKNWKQAEAYLKSAIEFIKEVGDEEYLEESKLTLADISFQKNDFQNCLKILNNIKRNKKQINNYSFNDKRLYQLLAKTYKQFGNHLEAASHFQQLVAIQDSLYNHDKLDLIAGLEARYQMEEKEKENVYLRAQQEQSEIILAQRKKTSLYITLLSILMSAVALLLFKAYYDKKQFNQTLQKQVTTKTQELLSTNNQLKASNIELERFAYIASHDLKEPLINISGFSSLLEQQLKEKGKDPSISKYLKIIKNNAKRMNQLIEDTLEFSRIENGKTHQLRKTSLDEVIEQVKQSLLTEMEEHNARIYLTLPSPQLYTNASQLFLVFKNLISNGIKYNTKKHKEIEISYKDQEGFHRFCVKDNGIGIDAKSKDEIFEMFKRLHNQRDYEGTGLGLAICKKIVINMGGKIWYESSIEGSQFYFTIKKHDSINGTVSEVVEEKTSLPIKIKKN